MLPHFHVDKFALRLKFNILDLWRSQIMFERERERERERESSLCYIFNKNPIRKYCPSVWDFYYVHMFTLFFSVFSNSQYLVN